MSLKWYVEDTFTFKNLQRLEVNKKINGKFYQFCYRMNVGENNMIYDTHNPNAGKNEAKKYNYLEIYSNNVNLFQDSPPGIGSGWDIEERQGDNNYYWDLSALYCTCSYSKSKPCSECDTCWKETQGDKLIYYESSYGSLVIRPLSLLCETTGYFKPISFKWKDKTGTFKLKIEPTRNISDDVGEINQIDFKFYSYNFQKTIAEIIEKGNHMSICFNKERARWGYGYLRRGKTGNKVDWITPYCIEGWEKDELGFDKWLKIKEVSNASDHTKPTKNKSNNLSLAVLNQLKEYFQKNDIKSIKLVGDKWVVEYNHNQKNNEYPVSSTPTSEFQALKNYFSKTNKNEITLAELNGDTNSTNPSQNQPDNKILVGCIFGGIGLLIMGVVISFIFKKKKVKKT